MFGGFKQRYLKQSLQEDAMVKEKDLSRLFKKKELMTEDGNMFGCNDENTEKTKRYKKAICIVERGGVERIHGEYIDYCVQGDQGRPYRVRFYTRTKKYECECEDHKYRGKACKHIIAVQIHRS